MSHGPKTTVVSGDRPTAQGFHLGHYVGVIKNRVVLSADSRYKMYLLIADFHALTTGLKKVIKNGASNEFGINHISRQLVAEQIACGVLPENVVFYRQSSIPGLASIYLLLSMFTSSAVISRVPTIKDMAKSAAIADSEISLGLMGYPVLQTADIMCCYGQLVPIGKDNIPHLELAREILRKVNNECGTSFPLPEALLSDSSALIGTDGKNKMSKSRNNCIMLCDSKEEIFKKVFKMYTDPNRTHSFIPGDTKYNPVFIYHRLFNTNHDEVLELEKLYCAGKVGDVVVKQALGDALEAFIKPIREKTNSLLQGNFIDSILRDGSLIVQESSNKVLKTLNSLMGLDRTAL